MISPFDQKVRGGARFLVGVWSSSASDASVKLGDKSEGF
jgi:hypothetical protein